MTIEQIIHELRLLSKSDGELKISWNQLHKDATLRLTIDLDQVSAAITEEALNSFINVRAKGAILNDLLCRLFVDIRSVAKSRSHH